MAMKMLVIQGILGWVEFCWRNFTKKTKEFLWRRLCNRIKEGFHKFGFSLYDAFQIFFVSPRITMFFPLLFCKIALASPTKTGPLFYHKAIEDVIAIRPNQLNISFSLTRGHGSWSGLPTLSRNSTTLKMCDSLGKQPGTTTVRLYLMPQAPKKSLHQK